MIFGIFGILMLSFDLTTIPFVLAWDVPIEGFMMLASWVSVGFWSFDLCMNFVTGFYRGGDLVMAPTETARHYISTWFLPDAAVVICDWASMLAMGNARRAAAG